VLAWNRLFAAPRGFLCRRLVVFSVAIYCRSGCGDYRHREFDGLDVDNCGGRMTPVIIGLANEDGVVMLKVIPPEPAVHWVWKWLYWSVIGGGYLGLVVGVWWSG
jgi:hypothetical protein